MKRVLFHSKPIIENFNKEGEREKYIIERTNETHKKQITKTVISTKKNLKGF